MTIIAALFCVLFLVIGGVVGWLGAERYISMMVQNSIMHEPHEFEELFQKNPHPELFDENGELNRGDDYIVINFPLGFDPSVDGFDIIPPDEEW